MDVDHETKSAKNGQKNLGGRLIDIMEAVVDAGEPVGPRGLARTVGIDRSAVWRVLQQLTELGILERREEGYIPGPRLFYIGRLLGARDTLPTAARSILNSLVAQFDETCYVCTLHGDSIVFLYEVQSSHPVRYVIDIGKPSPLHAGAAGRAILAGLTAEEASEILTRVDLTALTPRTIRDTDILLRMAAEDADRGYTVSLEERVPGGSAVAAPFFDGSGRCQGSVVFTCPAVRFDVERSEEIGKAVRAAADALSARLGYQVG
ncbi:MAG TPA: IclR family transcriptional regulator [Acidimicrobiia bacterium]|nr:IclR family transcriptional regulator [Acidimicrobiia bacterium]